MASDEQLAILKRGTKAWNAWREENKAIRPDLIWARHSKADLSKADLSKTNLMLAYLREADLSEANLSGADLREATLSWSNLSGANLRGANLRGAILRGADLSGADITEATIGRTAFGDVDLSTVKGLSTVLHFAPSTIGIDTLYGSQGKIPEVFLRGAGVPEQFITYIGSLVGKAIEFYSCFISYSTHDQEFATRLHADLQANGVRCWFAPHDIQSGKKIHEQIDEAIRLHDRLLLILSPNSINSNWVKLEISKAKKREDREAKRVLFPVRLVEFDCLREWEYIDADTGRDLAKEIREYFIPDFVRWKTDHDAYQEQFARLLRDLKTT